MEFPYRKKMVNDLVSNYKLEGLTYKELVDLLDSPQGSDGNSIWYYVDEDYGNDIDPVYSKSLIFYLDKDSIITGFKIKEYRK